MKKRAYHSPAGCGFKRLLNYLLILLLPPVGLLAGCGSTAETNTAQDSDAPAAVSHKIAIVNASSFVINAIKYKPCGSDDNRYQHLTGNLKPNETLSINVYAQCVDLIAVNAFKKHLVDAKNVDLDKIKTWTIK
ncbi:MAG TPA: hypothetical protein VIM41_14650 [Gammaproteobacteria bacterium]